MVEILLAGWAALACVLPAATVAAFVVAAAAALHRIPRFAERFALLERRRQAAFTPVYEPDAPAHPLDPAFAQIDATTSQLLTVLHPLVRRARGWPTDGSERSRTGFFADTQDFDGVTFATREVWEWVRAFDALPAATREALALRGLSADSIRAELTGSDDFFERFQRIVGALHGFSLGLRKCDADPFRGRPLAPIQQPDPSALVERHRADLKRVARRYAASPSEAEDLLQEITVAVWQALEQFRGESSERTYVLRIAHRVAAAHARRARAQPTDATPHPADTDLADTSWCPERRAGLHQKQARLAYALAYLPAKLRDVVRMRLLGHSYAEISGALDISETNVSVRLSRARRSLQTRLAPSA